MSIEIRTEHRYKISSKEIQKLLEDKFKIKGKIKYISLEDDDKVYISTEE